MELNEESLSPAEMKLLRDIILALSSLRYGSVNLTVHDGRLVEIQKVEKIRMNSTKAKGQDDSKPTPMQGGHVRKQATRPDHWRRYAI